MELLSDGGVHCTLTGRRSEETRTETVPVMLFTPIFGCEKLRSPATPLLRPYP